MSPSPSGRFAVAAQPTPLPALFFGAGAAAGGPAVAAATAAHPPRAWRAPTPTAAGVAAAAAAPPPPPGLASPASARWGPRLGSAAFTAAHARLDADLRLFCGEVEALIAPGVGGPGSSLATTPALAALASLAAATAGLAPCDLRASIQGAVDAADALRRGASAGSDGSPVRAAATQLLFALSRVSRLVAPTAGGGGGSGPWPGSSGGVSTGPAPATVAVPTRPPQPPAPTTAALPAQTASASPGGGGRGGGRRRGLSALWTRRGGGGGGGGGSGPALQAHHPARPAGRPPLPPGPLPAAATSASPASPGVVTALEAALDAAAASGQRRRRSGGGSGSGGGGAPPSSSAATPGPPPRRPTPPTPFTARLKAALRRAVSPVMPSRRPGLRGSSEEGGGGVSEDGGGGRGRPPPPRRSSSEGGGGPAGPLLPAAAAAAKSVSPLVRTVLAPPSPASPAAAGLPHTPPPLPPTSAARAPPPSRLRPGAGGGPSPAHPTPTARRPPPLAMAAALAAASPSAASPSVAGPPPPSPSGAALVMPPRSASPSPGGGLRPAPVCRICEERVRPAAALAAHTTACAAVEAALGGGGGSRGGGGCPPPSPGLEPSAAAALTRLADLARGWSGAEGAACVDAGVGAAARAGVAAAAAVAAGACAAGAGAGSAAHPSALDAAIAGLRSAASAAPPCSVADALGRRALRLARAVRRGGRAPSPAPTPTPPLPGSPAQPPLPPPSPLPLPPSSGGVCIADFEVLKPISRGAYGRVYLARKRATGDLYAVKVMRKADLVRKNAVAGAVTERDILAAADNPFVVRFYWAFTSPTAVYLVMEYAAGGDLASLLAGVGALDEGAARPYIAEAVLALAYCHARGVVHRDVKPDNLLIAGDGHVKLADFGLSTVGVVDRAAGLDGGSGGGGGGGAPATARRASGGGGAAAAPPSAQPPQPALLPRAVGTPDYLAPELLLGGSAAHGPAVDWWALGAVLFECVAGVPPFAADAPEGVFANILAQSIHWPYEEEEGGEEGGGGGDDTPATPTSSSGRAPARTIALSRECVDLITRLLDPDPATRLGAGPDGAAAVRAHPWFAGLDWAALAASKAALAPPFVPDLAGEEDTCYFAPRAGGVSRRSMALDATSLAGAAGAGGAGLPPATPWSVMRGGAEVEMREGLAAVAPPHHAPLAPQEARALSEDGDAATTTSSSATTTVTGLPPHLTRATSIAIAAAAAGAAFAPGEAFRNFSFKNVAGLGAANAAVAGALAALRAEFRPGGGGGSGVGGGGSPPSDAGGGSSSSDSEAAGV